jgi:hypothetical protein
VLDVAGSAVIAEDSGEHPLGRPGVSGFKQKGALQ